MANEQAGSTVAENITQVVLDGFTGAGFDSPETYADHLFEGGLIGVDEYRTVRLALVDRWVNSSS